MSPRASSDNATWRGVLAMHKRGLVVGRFQPLHLGHQEYIIAASRRCERLYVGITHPDNDPSKFYYHQSDPHRSKASANPFSFDMRRMMVEGLLGEYSIDPSRYTVVPIRLANSEDVHAVVPADTVVFVTVYDEWGVTKKSMFEEMGFEVEVLWNRRETVTRGRDVRARIREGGEWQHLVPPSTYAVISDWLAAGNGLNGGSGGQH
jgi:cytidyltransferase-like protein